MSGVSSFAAERSSRETAWELASRGLAGMKSLLNLLPLSGLNQPFRVPLSERQLPLKHMMGGQVSAGCGEGIPANHTCAYLPLTIGIEPTRRLDTATRQRVHLKTSKQRHREKPKRNTRTGRRLGRSSALHHVYGLHHEHKPKADRFDPMVFQHRRVRQDTARCWLGQGQRRDTVQCTGNSNRRFQVHHMPHGAV